MPEWRSVGNRRYAAILTIIDLDTLQTESETLQVEESWDEGCESGLRGRDTDGVLTEVHVREVIEEQAEKEGYWG